MAGAAGSNGDVYAAGGREDDRAIDLERPGLQKKAARMQKVFAYWRGRCTAGRQRQPAAVGIELGEVELPLRTRLRTDDQIVDTIAWSRTLACRWSAAPCMSSELAGESAGEVEVDPGCSQHAREAKTTESVQ
jgi:hypothetical protein